MNYRLLTTSSVLFLVVILLQGCTASKQLQKEASSVLNGGMFGGVCLDWFSSRYYQHNSRLMRTAFAVAIDNNGGVVSCGWAVHSDISNSKKCIFGCPWKVTQAEIDALALGRCQAYGATSGVSSSTHNSTCKIYARKQVIVWDESQKSSQDLKDTMDFE